MASHLRFSGSGFSRSSAGSSRSGAADLRGLHSPPPPPGGGGLGGRPAEVEEPGWTRVQSRKEILRSRRLQPPLPTHRTWGVRPVPPQLRGLCYNCLEPDHISAFCTNPTRCFLCGGQYHQSRNCASKGPRPAPAMEATGVGEARLSRKAAPGRGEAAAQAQGRGPVPMEQDSCSSAESAAPVPGGGTAWRDVARGRAEPPAREALQGGGLASGSAEEDVDVCVITPSAEMVDREELLRRAVLVTVTGGRPEVDLSDAAGLIHDRLEMGPFDFSIRAFAPEDFLILCSSMKVRDRILRARQMTATWFSLAFKPWIRQHQAELHHAPFLACVDLLGVPAHAWELDTARALLRKAGWVEGVDSATSSWNDMSKFRVQLWTEDPRRIPAVRALDIVEPDVGTMLHVHQTGRGGSAKKTLRYKIRFAVSDVRGGGRNPPPPPPEASPPSAGPESSPERNDPRERRGPPPPPQARNGRGGGRHAGEDRGGGRQWRPVVRQRLHQALAVPASPEVGSSKPPSPAAFQAETAASGCGAGPTTAVSAEVVPVAGSVGPEPGSEDAVADAFVQTIVPSQNGAASPDSVVGPRGFDWSLSPLAPRMDDLADSCAEEELDERVSGRRTVDLGMQDPALGTHSVIDKSSMIVGSLDGDEDWRADQSVPSFGSPISFVVVDVEDEGITPAQASPSADRGGFFTPIQQDRNTVILNELLAEIRAHTRSPLLPLPNVQATRRRNKKYSPGGAPRRSLRLALKAPSRPASMVKRSQRVLMHKLGICCPEEVITPEHLDMYAKEFEAPLSSQQLHALAALFALSVPEESEQSLSF